MLDTLIYTLRTKVLEIQASPSVGSQLHATQQEVLIIFRGQHLLLLPVLLGYNLLCLCFLLEYSRDARGLIFMLVLILYAERLKS